MNKLKLKFINWMYRVYFKRKEQANELEFIDKYLKRKGYDEYGDIYTKAFTVIKINKKSNQLFSIEIWHDGQSKAKHTIQHHFSTGLIIAEMYFSKI